MNLTPYSRNRILETFQRWNVPKEFADPMYNYLVYGFSPGSCFTSVLANDFLSAVSRSHPGNTIEAFKALAGWIRDTVPAEARGSYAAVDHWLSLTGPVRREVLESAGLVLTADQEMWATLKNVRTTEPVLY
jgi:hypothetical protein